MLIGGVTTPNSVTMPPVMSDAGVTSNDGFQQSMPKNNENQSQWTSRPFRFAPTLVTS